jgi:hypothetical protein
VGGWVGGVASFSQRRGGPSSACDQQGQLAAAALELGLLLGLELEMLTGKGAGLLLPRRLPRGLGLRAKHAGADRAMHGPGA